MDHSLSGWDIGRFGDIDWVPWDAGDKARAKVLAVADGFHVALVEPGAGYRDDHTNTTSPSSSTSSTAPSAPRAGR